MLRKGKGLFLRRTAFKEGHNFYFLFSGCGHVG
jgi:hypothetical protein